MTDIRKALNNEVNTVMNFVLDTVDHEENLDTCDFGAVKKVRFDGKEYLVKMTVEFEEI